MIVKVEMPLDKYGRIKVSDDLIEQLGRENLRFEYR